MSIMEMYVTGRDSDKKHHLQSMEEASLSHTAANRFSSASPGSPVKHIPTISATTKRETADTSGLLTYNQNI